VTFHFEKEALVASGIKEHDQIAGYIAKLGHLDQQFIRETRPTQDTLIKAKELFDWLWRKKPHRYRSHGSYRLSETIDSQLSGGSQVVGNCLGLTLLYNCLLRRAGIFAEALHLENAFGKGPHVLSIFRTKKSVIDIENILPDGFEYKGHLNDPSRTRWGDRELVADIYHSQGNEFYEKGSYAEALRSYDRAIELNPLYERARLNKAIVLDRIGLNKEID
jgi:tetratricopeptide (TPR) repeat protein